MSKPAIQNSADKFNITEDNDKATITLARAEYEVDMNAWRVKQIEDEQITSQNIRAHGDTPQVTVQDIKDEMNRPMIERELEEDVTTTRVQEDEHEL